MSMRLVLFDIDGTLIRSNFTGRRVMSRALQEVFGTAGALDGYSFAGKTDLGIISDLLFSAGFNSGEIAGKLPELYDVMAREGEILFAQEDLVPCLGVGPLMEALRAESKVILGLQTGNIRPTAIQKLRAAALDPGRFPVAAFGSDSAEREDLLPAAWRRAEKLTGFTFTGDNTVVIGDTPGDIRTARKNGALAVAVASGMCDKQVLVRHQPDVLLPDLTDTQRVMRILTGDRNT